MNPYFTKKEIELSRIDPAILDTVIKKFVSLLYAEVEEISLSIMAAGLSKDQFSVVVNEYSNSRVNSMFNLEISREISI